MSSKASNQPTEQTASSALDALGDECARIILVATSESPRTAKELTERTDSSSATVYRRINDLIESNLLEECIRFEEDGSHTTAYEATIDHLSVRIDADGICVVPATEDE